jgi:thioesterase domain-containing protein/acyl carrier protein
VVSEGGFAVDPFFDLLNEFGATWYTAVPTIHRAILERAPAHIPQIAAIAARGGLRFVRSGSAPMPAGIPARLESLFHTIYIEASGATEASAYICSNRPGQRRIGSVGLPMPGTEVRILDESLKPVGTGVTGELVARGPGIFRGYEGDTENHCFADGFFRTGDLGHVDADGFFYITGRIKEQINRAGLKISPGEVDEVLLRHPAVAEAVTFAISDDRLGQEIAAAIVLRNAATTTDLDIQRFASQYLADYKVPRRIVFVHDIPKTASGKVLRIDLVRQLNLDGTTANNNGTEPRTVTGLNKPITPLEQAVAVIFSDVLNRPVWDINAPLHALGADSLQALNICLALENRFGRSIPLAALTVHPSIRGISDLLSGDAVAFPPGSPITLREGTSGGPLLFVFPGVGGNIYSYHGLVRQLPKEWRVIGIPLPGADGLEEPLSSMDALADRFLKTIEPALRTHRCFLLGYSFGGKLAFEVAHRLSDSGLQPPTLILCDTPAPGWPPKLTWGKKLKSYVVRAREDGMMAAFRQLFDRKFSAGPGAVVSSSEEESASESSGRAAGIQKEVERRLLEASRAAIQNWRTSPAALHIYLLRASEMLWRAYDRSDSHMGWEDIALGGVHASAIPGKHVTIFDEVNVRAMAERTIGIVNEVLSTSPEVQPDRPMILSSALST